MILKPTLNLIDCDDSQKTLKLLLNNKEFNEEIVICPFPDEHTISLRLLKLSVYCKKNNIRLVSIGTYNQFPMLSIFSDAVILHKANNSKIYSIRSENALEINKEKYINYIDIHKNTNLINKIDDISLEEIFNEFFNYNIFIRKSSMELFSRLKLNKNIIACEIKENFYPNLIESMSNLSNKYNFIKGVDKKFQKELIKDCDDHYMSIQILASLFLNWKYIVAGGAAHLFTLIPCNTIFCLETEVEDFKKETKLLLEHFVFNRYNNFPSIFTYPMQFTTTGFVKKQDNPFDVFSNDYFEFLIKANITNAKPIDINVKETKEIQYNEFQTKNSYIGIKEVSHNNISYKLSSSHDAFFPLQSFISNEERAHFDSFTFHTKEGNGEHAIIDMGEIGHIKSISIINRKDCCQDRIIGMNVSCSTDGINFKHKYKISDSFLEQLIEINETSRYIKLGFDEEHVGALHLYKIKINKEDIKNINTQIETNEESSIKKVDFIPKNMKLIKCNYKTSSNLDRFNPLNSLTTSIGNSYDSSFAFHTKEDFGQYVEIFTEEDVITKYIEIQNRKDCCQERAKNINIWVNDDKNPIWINSDTFYSLKILINKKVNKLKIGLSQKEKGILHLYKVKLYTDKNEEDIVKYTPIYINDKIKHNGDYKNINSITNKKEDGIIVYSDVDFNVPLGFFHYVYAVLEDKNHFLTIENNKNIICFHSNSSIKIESCSSIKKQLKELGLKYKTVNLEILKYE